MKRRLFNIAWSIVDQFNSFAEALAHAWKVIKLQYALCTQALVRFKYIKVSDGSVREAVGTLDGVPVTTGKKVVNYGLLTYFDLDAAGWRSCRIENLIF
ncbi:hypothetical protein SAMN05421821_105156 [Mucilaginibacter lappiensis]|uniref:Uncharacterized protein n=1 Tax=Mucilaginibacter lappiensis TaxID=354630 RepID=A0ABR6PJE8_9SPHI|nr:SH3 beta-barrel fold-containing protein [Mucilaginibacter lappiensis]MBB6109738.1 hypothetical protein [Mucilaginibacter lappiensis]SIR13736.1 hypothetical protein SAMN05421821_105156 [Mucilaginibacter lappiensis]